MGIIIGIDIGGSTTKIVGIQGKEIITPLMVRATDPIASLFGAFGKFIDQNNLALLDVERIAITGVGASHVDKAIYGIETVKVEEFLANGYGGLYISGLESAIIVSMGTGTALVHATKDHIEHIGGTGMGGGTILGLSHRMLNIREIDFLIETAKEGNLANVDLAVSDISREEFPTLPSNTTASNFGKIADIATRGDIALGIFNLVFQTIGMMSFFAASYKKQREIVLIGNLTTIPQCREIFDSIEKLYNIHFIIPPHSEYATAVGAALSMIQSND